MHKGGIVLGEEDLHQGGEETLLAGGLDIVFSWRTFPAGPPGRIWRTTWGRPERSRTPTLIISGVERGLWSLDPSRTWSTHWTSWTEPSWMAVRSSSLRRTSTHAQDPGPTADHEAEVVTVQGRVTGPGLDLRTEVDQGTFVQKWNSLLFSCSICRSRSRSNRRSRS